MLVQDFLKNGGTLEDLKAKYGIKAKFGVKHPNLVSLKYNQIESPMGDPLVQECRGVIFDSNTWEIVARPFDKFFNAEEGHAKPIDWKTARVQEKLDGSLMNLYFYKGSWEVGSSGTPDGSGEIKDFGLTFSGLFWQMWKDHGYVFPQETNKTFMFEMCHLYNKVVIAHKEPKLVLIGVRDTQTGIETPVEEYCPLFKVVKSYPLNSLKKIKETFQMIDPLTQEGYVVVDGVFNRQKIKHPGYVAIHHMLDSMSLKTFLEVIRQGESDEFLAYAPEYANDFLRVKRMYEWIVRSLESDYEKISHIESQKEFAIGALKSLYPSVLFSMRKSGDSVKKVLASVSIDTLMKTLKL